MLVRATTLGIFGAQMRYPGDEFEVPEDFKASWAVPVDESTPVIPTKKEAKQEPVALSQFGKSQPASFVDHFGSKKK